MPKFSRTSVEPVEDDQCNEEIFNAKLLHDDRNSTSELKISRQKTSFHDVSCGPDGVQHRRRVVNSPKSEQIIKRASRKVWNQSRSHPFVVTDSDFGKLDYSTVEKADAVTSVEQKKTVEIYYVDDPMDQKYL